MRERDTGREGGPRADASQNEPTKAHDGHSLPPRHARIPSPLRRRDGGRMTCRVIARLCLVIGVLAYGTAADAQVLQGLSLFQQHCAACHAAPSADSRAPNRDALRDRTPESILDSLTTGAMAPVAAKIPDNQKRIIAEFLTGRPLGAAASGHASAMKNLCPQRDLGDPLTGPMWNGWGVDLTNGRFQSAAAAGLTADSVPRLKLKWAFGFPEGRSAFGQPSVVGGRIYVGADTGFLYALDAATGCVYWSFQAEGGIRNAITIGPNTSGSARYAAYFGDLKANAYAVDITNGTLLWKMRADTHPVARITGAPKLHEGRVYVPVSSLEEAVGATPGYECCTFRGSLVAYDANTGRQLWKTYTIPEPARPRGKTSAGVQLWGPAGAAVWGSPTIDARRRIIYLTTSNAYTLPAADTSDSVMALDMESGRRLWVRQLTPDDAFLVGCPSGPAAPGTTAPAKNENCPEQLGPDFAIGSSAILRTLPDGKSMLAVGQKSGISYGIDAEDGTIRWQHRVGQGSTLGGIEWGGAADDQVVYFPNADARFGPDQAGGWRPCASRPGNASGSRSRHRPARTLARSAFPRSRPRQRRFLAWCSPAQPTA